ncbi:MAG: DUF4249 domain-containing protein [Tannerella sp.]|jgi:hypothetical protein|nr:DUF4249 domain-containing protein [Tannerella sp.]
MKKAAVYLCIIASISGCSVDFNPTIDKASECIVINSLLQPDSLITVRLYAAVVEDRGMKTIPLQNAYVILKENQVVIFEGVVDSVLNLNIYPKTGALYSIEAIHAGYSQVHAETSIPTPIYCKVDCDEERIIDLYEFDIPDNRVPLWITASALFTDTDPLQFAELYCNNLLVDNFNREEGSDIVNKQVGSGYHESFLRIKTENQIRLETIQFLPMLNRSILWENFSGIEIRLIAASKEYDQYCKTYYQLLDIPISDDISAILYQPVHVYSNIIGGLGIFAGKSDIGYFFEETN